MKSSLFMRIVRKLRPPIVTAVCLFASTPHAHDFNSIEDPGELSLSSVADQVFVAHGVHALPNNKNAGFISNSGVVITDSGVIVIDTGGSRVVGEALVSRIREITRQPIVAVFNTHIHGDHWLGNAAFRQASPDVRIFAHQRAIDRLKNGEAETWRDLMAGMTEDVQRDARVVLPDQALKGGETLEIAGVTLKIHHTGHAHTDGDLMIEMPSRQVLFTGDIVEHGRAVSSDVPQDFDARGQIAAIDYALALPVTIYVPGHGLSGGRDVPEAALRFLEVLYGSVKRNYGEGKQDYEMRGDVESDLSEFSHWFNFEEIGRLVSHVYLQVEQDDFQ